MRRLLFCLAISLLTSNAQAQQFDEAAQYAKCLDAAQANPTQGWEMAIAWTSLGGGEASRHCAAVALTGLGKFEEAASRLESLAQESRREPAIRAGMLAQAGQAWLLADQRDRAFAAQSAALQLLPDDPDLRIDRAVTLADAGDFEAALEDLQIALTADPNRVDALVLRASARRYQEDYQGALTDLEAAISLDFAHAEAWLEYGMIKRIIGEDATARDAWLRVLDLAPDSQAALTAQANIARMDLK